jgi:RHS repeat-associated protein
MSRVIARAVRGRQPRLRPRNFGVLTVNNGSATVASLDIAGDYTAADFSFTSDNNGGTDIELIQNPGTLSIAAPAAATTGAGQTEAIAGVSIALSPTTSGETFTVTLSDTNGVLAATGGTPSNGGKTLTINGSLTQVDSALLTLTDADGTAGSDTITINATDGNGGTATPKQIAITVNGPPAIAAPTSTAVALNRATAVHGISLSESGNTSNETFTVTLADANGHLSASGSGVSGSGTTSLTISGSLSQVNADLATLTDADATNAPDTITVNASDSFGNIAGQQQVAVIVNGPPVIAPIAVLATVIINQDQATPILVASLSENGSTANETFTVTVSDNNGLLSATGPGVSGTGTTTLTISGSLAQVDSDLTTLTDTDPSSAADKITINATDSLGDQAATQSIPVAVQPLTLGALEGIVATTGSVTIDWTSLNASLRPTYIDATDWNLIWNRFVALAGSSTQSLVAALKPVAAELNAIDPVPNGPSAISVATLLSYELQQAVGALPNIILADTTDVAPAGAGLDLSLTRSYSASLLNRNNPGPFGDGWMFTYGISAATDASGNVYISSPSGVELFTLQPNGTYAAQAGDSSVLTLSGGAYVLTSINGTVERFLADGQISSITDSNGNTINVSYGSNGVISGVTSSNGQSLTFTTNAQGRIVSATDEEGRQTTYTYDGSGNLLLSVSGPNGATSYGYESNGNALDQNALTQITNPDGTTENFQYDTQGNLTSQSGANGAGQVTYNYPATGTVTATDAAGNSATLIFDTNGNLAETTDPLGNVTKFQYNSSSELTGVVTPTGGTYTYSYDSNGNLIGDTDPNGGTVSATYAPGTDLLTSFTDQNGNKTTYSYNSAGDLTGVTYDNGSGTSYQYSSSGLLTSSTDARGQTTTYAYNAQGLLTEEAFSDGTFQAYAYNTQGELISAQATNGGVTTFGYNAAGELTSVTNPSGQVESYTYDSAGQELTRAEPDGSVTRYSYNAAGELAALKDGSGNPITQYTYNALGQLVGSHDGNGQTTSYQYDADGNVTQILIKAANGTVTSQLNYTYDADGQPVTATSLDGTWTYTYDAAGQLTNAVFASTNSSIPNQNLTYKYDAAGNRTQTIFNGAVNNYTTNGLNQYTAANGATYNYDADGNLVSMTQNGATTTYTYNSQNQLTAVTGPNGNCTYQYDALGNMVSSTDNGVVNNYIIDPLAISTSATGPLSAIAQVYNASGSVTATYDYGNGLAAVINSSGTYYYNTDVTGNVTSLSGAGGNLVDTYDYMPFGTLLASTNGVANPFQYLGGLGITTGAGGLIDMRARFYDSMFGRFLTHDPSGIAGGTNLYNYANNQGRSPGSAGEAVKV